MSIAANSVVSLHYSLSAESGKEIENSRQGAGPIQVLVGHGGIIPGLERALLGREAGDAFEVVQVAELIWQLLKLVIPDV